NEARAHRRGVYHRAERRQSERAALRREPPRRQASTTAPSARPFGRELDRAPGGWTFDGSSLTTRTASHARMRAGWLDAPGSAGCGPRSSPAFFACRGGPLAAPTSHRACLSDNRPRLPCVLAPFTRSFPLISGEHPCPVPFSFSTTTPRSLRRFW